MVEPSLTDLLMESTGELKELPADYHGVARYAILDSDDEYVAEFSSVRVEGIEVRSIGPPTSLRW